MLKNILNLNGASLLTREQQKEIKGEADTGGTCCAIITHGGGTFNNGAITMTCGLTKKQAQTKALLAALEEDTRGQWCCDSC